MGTPKTTAARCVYLGPLAFEAFKVNFKTAEGAVSFEAGGIEFHLAELLEPNEIFTNDANIRQIFTIKPKPTVRRNGTIRLPGEH